MAVIERVGAGSVLRGAVSTLEITVYSDGVATDPTVASVTAVDEQGNAVGIGAASITGGSTGKVTTAAAVSTTAKSLTLTWSLTVGGTAQTFTTYHEVLGDFLFTEAELRAFDGGAVANTTTYTDSDISNARELVRVGFEQICNVAFGERAKRAVLDGDGTATIWLGDMQVKSVTAAATRETGSATWTALTVAELADLLVSPNGRVIRDSLGTWPSGNRNVRVDYTYGYQPIPGEVRRAAMWVARNYLTGSNIPRNAISQVDDLGTFQLSVPGQRGSWYGFPEVDRVLRDYRSRNSIPGVA